MSALGSVKTGRIDTRHYCASCEQRIKYGTPTVSESWPARLHGVPLSKEQWELLLVAAAEFERIGGGGAVEFMDWCRPDALNLVAGRYPEFAGTSRTENGGTHPGSMVVRHTQPFPLPLHRTPPQRSGAS